MVREKNSVLFETKPAPFNGKGEITVRFLLNAPEEMYGKGRVFAHTTVYPGAAIGYHIHHNEAEVYYILSGEAEFNDNGRMVRVHGGDVTFTGAGEGHGIEAVGEEPVEMIALIYYQ